MIITRSHLDQLPEPYCAKGARRWAARLNLDWAAFVRDGIDSDVLIATGDAMALRLVDHAMRCAEAGNGI